MPTEQTPEWWSQYSQMLYSEFDDERNYPNQAPLLAHYTSMSNLENILKNDEIWLSNPLLMNDVEEVRFGINSAMNAILGHERLNNSLETRERQAILHKALNDLYSNYGETKVLDLYVICFSEHEPSDFDGQLSMWRGYGKNGFGASLVFDSSVLAPNADKMPYLILAPVEYGSSDERLKWINSKFDEIAEFFRKNSIDNEGLIACAAELFARICVFAVFSKHRGFSEERERRLVYFQDRDVANAMSPMFGYLNGNRGLAPVLKLNVPEVARMMDVELSIEKIVDRIILGPTSASPIAMLTARRMLEKLGKEKLAGRLQASAIPFRG